MKQSRFFLLIVCAFLCVNVASAAKWKAKHVVLIGLDGWGAYSVEKAEMPTVKKLMADGSYTLKKRSVLPSSSAVNWASMFMGQDRRFTGLRSGAQRSRSFRRVRSAITVCSLLCGDCSVMPIRMRRWGIFMNGAA